VTPILALLLAAMSAFASSSFEVEGLSDKYHITADRTLYHSKEKVYEAFGHVVVSSKGKRMSSDYLWFDTRTQEVQAKGNVVFVDTTSTITAAEIHLNYSTGIGSIFYGKVANDLYSLRGQLIRKVSPDRFLTTEGEYTTCKDCAESWKLAAKNVDVTVDGYAFMDSVVVKVKDIPTVYFPYLIVPVKTKRQTGLLFPRIGVNSNHGFEFVQPLFLDISDHQDITLGLGRYSSRGTRYEMEYRYRSYDGIKGSWNIFHTKDRKVSFASHRTALKTENLVPLSKWLEFKMRAYEVLDRDYPLDFPEDIIGTNLPALESNLIGAVHFPQFFFSAEAKRYRNLLYDQPVGFDGGTVQSMPTMHAGIRETKILGPFLGNFYSRYDVFQRRNGSFFDADGNRLFESGGIENIREANRWILQPELSAPFRVGRFLRFNPSLQYNEIRYQFSVPTFNGPVPNTQTRYLLGRLEASTVVERVFAYNGKDVSRVKHQLTPFVSFSSIPWLARGNTNHPFNGTFGQLRSESGAFDQYDIIPITNDTNFLRYPQGKSVYYGFTSRLIRKLRGENDALPRPYPFDKVEKRPKKYPVPYNRKTELAIERMRKWDKFGPHYGDYQEVWTLNASQAYDFKTAEKFRSDKKRAFSYLLAKSDLSVDQFSHNLEYRFFPRIVNRKVKGTGASAVTTEEVFSNKQFLSTGFTWHWKDLKNMRKTRSFVRNVSANFTNSSHPNASRTVGGGLNWSLNDYLGFNGVYDYDLLSQKSVNWSAQTLFTHYSECWGLLFRYDWQRTREPKRSEFGFQLLVNLFGTGFLGSDTIRDGGPAGIFGGG